MASVPAGWVLKRSRSKEPGRVYYVNERTGERVWADEFEKTNPLKRTREDASMTGAPLSVIGSSSAASRSFQPLKAAKTDSSSYPITSTTPCPTSSTSTSQPTSQPAIIVASGQPYVLPAQLLSKVEMCAESPPVAAIRINRPHVKREVLLKDLESRITIHSTTLIVAPQGQGKTSTIQNFLEYNTGWIRLMFEPEQSSESLVSQFRRIVGLNSDTVNIINTNGNLAALMSSAKIGVLLWIDDAQKWYADKHNEFWNYLLRTAIPRLQEKGAKFAVVISATQTTATKGSSPVDLRLITNRVTSVKMSDAEAVAMIVQEECPYGLHPAFHHQELIDLIVAECDGHAAALRISIDLINELFTLGNDCVEDASRLDLCLKTYLSGFSTMRFKNRCFGTPSSTNERSDVIKPFQSLLVDMLSGTVDDPFALLHDIPHADKTDRQKGFEGLRDSGIIAFHPQGTVEYASPLAVRVMSLDLFADRAPFNTEISSLKTLVVDAVKGLSSLSLRNAAVGRLNLKEASYQHLLMAQLCKLMPPNISIAPELSSTYFRMEKRVKKIGGSLDVYISRLHFGLELLVDGSKLSEHTSRFAPNGKYASLKCADYLIVDCRVDAKDVKVYDENHQLTFRFSNDMSSATVFEGKMNKGNIYLR